MPFFVYNKIATKWSGIADHCGYVSMTDTDKATCAHFTPPGHSLADLRVCQGINRKKLKQVFGEGGFFQPKLIVYDYFTYTILTVKLAVFCLTFITNPSTPSGITCIHGLGKNRAVDFAIYIVNPKSMLWIVML